MKKQPLLLLIGSFLFLTLLCSIAFSTWQVILEMQCLDLNLSNVNCTYTNENHTTAVGIMEPLLSAVLVLQVFLFYSVNHLPVNCANTKWYNILVQNWCVKRFVPTIVAIAYYALVYAGNLVSFDTGPYRYISMIFGLTSWFLLLTVSNENGSLSCVWKKTQTTEGEGSAKITIAMKTLSLVLFLFACLTNLLEFMVFTVYITKTITTLNVPSVNKRVLNALDFLGMTVVIALRLDFASFFGDMAILSLKDVGYGHQVKFLQDPWDERENKTGSGGTPKRATKCDKSRSNGSSTALSSQGKGQENSSTQNMEDTPVNDTGQCYAAPTEKSSLLRTGSQRKYTSNSINSDIICLVEN